MDKITEGIVTEGIRAEGIVESAVAGVVVALILGIYGWGRRKYHRTEQIRHIKAVIEKGED